MTGRKETEQRRCQEGRIQNETSVRKEGDQKEKASGSRYNEGVRKEEERREKVW